MSGSASCGSESVEGEFVGPPLAQCRFLPLQVTNSGINFCSIGSLHASRWFTKTIWSATDQPLITGRRHIGCEAGGSECQRRPCVAAWRPRSSTSPLTCMKGCMALRQPVRCSWNARLRSMMMWPFAELGIWETRLCLWLERSSLTSYGGVYMQSQHWIRRHVSVWPMHPGICCATRGIGWYKLSCCPCLALTFSMSTGIGLQLGGPPIRARDWLPASVAGCSCVPWSDLPHLAACAPGLKASSCTDYHEAWPDPLTMVLRRVATFGHLVTSPFASGGWTSSMGACFGLASRRTLRACCLSDGTAHRQSAFVEPALGDGAK